MPKRSPLLGVAVLLAMAGCRRDAQPLGDVSKMAYEVKPAVVRISAYATADLRYPAGAIREVASELRVAREVEGAEATVTTGAGGSGSGFIVNPNGVILTSGHVVAPTRDLDALRQDLLRNGAIAALVKHFPVDQLRTLHRDEGLEPYITRIADASRLEHITVVNEVELSNGEKLPFRILRYSPALSEQGIDVAVLQIGRQNLPVLPLGDSDTVRVGDAIWAVGYPAVASSSDEVIGGWLSRDSDLEATVNPGQITALKNDRANKPVLQTNVAIYRGNSGGPAVNGGGEVIGISTWGHTDAEQIKFLVPVSLAREMLAAAGVKPSTDGEFNRSYRAALDEAYEGKWADARSDLDRASKFFPGSPDLIRFRHDIDRAIRDLPLWRLYPVTTAASFAFVGLLGLGSIVWIARRPRLARDVLTTTTEETVVAPNGTPAASPAAAMLGRFTILNGNRAGQKLGLGGSGIRIGREATVCEIVLENPKVSRLHAEVVSIDGKVLLIDRNSSNGTFVNDQKIDKRFLQDGDIIYFGGRNAVAVAFHA
ncbi:MAG TPA: trypsin-like peptidase domain-containing protein [Thermoanaerobaculia bacterium]|jgi:S1-C subfamily serine protease|nr:trypsin-like peptidase domain-containing protein [Thermoanaerobaculia bacterium]